MAIRNLKKKLNNELKYYCKNQIWNFLDSSDILGIKLESGETVYVNLVYRTYDSRGTILIFKDLEALGTCVSLFPTTTGNNFKYAYDFVLQDCLCVALEWGMPGAEPGMPYIEENILKPGFSIKEVTNPKDLELIYKVLLELKKLTGIVKAGDKSLRANKIYPAVNGRGLLNVFEFKNNKANLIRRIAMDYKKKPYPKVIYNNDLLISKFKRIPHYGKWILEILYPPDIAEYDQESDSFKLKNSLYLLDPEYGYEEFILFNSDSTENPDEFLNEFAKELLDFDILPTEVFVRDDKTYTLLEDFFNKVDVDINLFDQIPEMQALERRIFADTDLPEEPFGDETLNLDDFKEIEDNYGYIPTTQDNPYARRILKKLKEYREETGNKED